MKYLLVKLKKRTALRMQTMANKIYAMTYDLKVIAEADCEVNFDALPDSDPFKLFCKRLDDAAAELMEASRRQTLPTESVSSAESA